VFVVVLQADGSACVRGASASLNGAGKGEHGSSFVKSLANIIFMLQSLIIA
jgi:hypothetical protein